MSRRPLSDPSIRPLGLPRRHYRQVGSTNHEAKELANRGAPHGTLVTTEEQKTGRGRQGRRWSAPPGRAVLMSLVLRDLEPAAALLPLAAALAVCEASESAASVGCRIKWPNDVLIDRRKVAGILVEARPRDRWAVLGIGLNVTTDADELPAEIRDSATSLRLAARTGADRSHLEGVTAVESVLSSLLARLEDRLAAPPEIVLAGARDRDALRGERVHWAGGEGIARGIDDVGALRVDTAAGQVALDAGEVHLA